MILKEIVSCCDGNGFGLEGYASRVYVRVVRRPLKTHELTAKLLCIDAQERGARGWRGQSPMAARKNGARSGELRAGFIRAYTTKCTTPSGTLSSTYLIVKHSN